MAAENSSDGLYIRSACTASAEFIKLYYDFVDKVRHKLNKLYMPDAVLVWNGNRVEGAAAIQKFYEDLPVSQHTVRCYDAQPVNSRAVGEQLSLLLCTGGSVTFKGKRSDFHQSFLITSQDDKWKIVSDCFRFQEFVPADATTA